MKRVLLTLLVFAFIQTSVFSNTMTEDKISDAISLYKNGEYSECIKNLNTIISQDSSYPVAYYYLGLANARLGKKDLAIKNYNKVLAISSDKTLKTMAKAAKDCLGTSGFTALDAQLVINNNSNAEKLISPEIKKEVQIKETAVKEAKKASQPKPIKAEDKNEKMPTNDEIGAAIMVLKKAGLWNGNTQSSFNNNSQNHEDQQNMMAKMYMQQMTQQMNNPAYLMMNMNGNNNNNGMNNMMNMLPFMMNNQNGTNNPAMNQQFIQTMMMSQMMPNLDFSSSDNK